MGEAILLGHKGGNFKPAGVIYGVKIDENNSNPESALTYTDDAVGFEPAYMDFATNTFNYGSWQDKFPFNQIKPCLFEDGEVVGYLNPNNYAEFEDGSPADITSGDSGDVMVEFPKIWWKFERIGTDLYVRFASYKVDETFKCLAHIRGDNEVDKIYISAYLGSVISSKLRSLSSKTPTVSTTLTNFRANAKNLHTGFDVLAYHQLTMLQVLFLVMFKNRDSQTALGRGYTVNSNSSLTTTGNTNTRGMFFGENTGALQNKFCGIEDFFGNILYWIEGIFLGESRRVYISKNEFNDTNTGYEDYGTVITSDLYGPFVKEVVGTTELGFLATKGGGSQTTYYADYTVLSSNQILNFGSAWALDRLGGVFCFISQDRTASAINIGARLMAR